MTAKPSCTPKSDDDGDIVLKVSGECQGKKYGWNIVIPKDIKLCSLFIDRMREVAGFIAVNVLKDVYGDDVLKRCSREYREAREAYRRQHPESGPPPSGVDDS